MKIIGYLIIKNEEKNLQQNLPTLKVFLDDIVIVDTGSEDKSKEIASKYGKVFQKEWTDDFAEAKNFAKEKAESEGADWTIWFDADERVTEETGKKIREKILQLPAETQVVMLPWNYAFDAQGRVTLRLQRERLVRAGVSNWIYPIHEILDIQDLKHTVWNDCPIDHYRQEWKKGRNLAIFQKIMANEKWAENPRMLYYYANELRDNENYDEAIKVYKEYLKRAWWNEEIYLATVHLAKCYFSQGKIKEAKETAIDAFKIFENRAENSFLLGEIAMREKRYNDAIRWFENCLIDVPNGLLGVYIPYYNYETYRKLVFAYNYVGKIAEARQYCIKYLFYYPDDKDFLFNLMLFNKHEKVYKVGWTVTNDKWHWENGSHRIRRLLVHEELNRGNKCISMTLDGNWEKGLECQTVVICTFSEETLRWIKRYKQAGIKIIFDDNEFISHYPYQDAVMKEADYIVCCSHRLCEERIRQGFKQALIIEDGWK